MSSFRDSQLPHRVPVSSQERPQLRSAQFELRSAQFSFNPMSVKRALQICASGFGDAEKGY
jgi:hypothetical protein